MELLLEMSLEWLFWVFKDNRLIRSWHSALCRKNSK